ncbi:MAG: hypothetical protein COW08_00330 [Ignavibacteriales bacterium CG12_big_fil_rev_8_21_14_0_65_30_8]|nr:MAG: hypothetical protein COW08_00330 [Ignavibacteriales bacterium CG12_big_fil_rev_8_21_14_0_65_30_8]
MDFTKQYINQSISAASNNLRLDTQKIEVVSLLREFISKSDNLEKDIKLMKTCTEFSTLAIRIAEIHRYLTQGTIDLLKISDKFKEHCQYLISDLSKLLDSINPNSFREAIKKIKGDQDPNAPISNENNSFYNPPNNYYSDKTEAEILKEKIIMDDEPVESGILFQNFEEVILQPIKNVDEILKTLLTSNQDPEELIKYCEILESNGDLAEERGFGIISNMHNIVAKALLLIRANELTPTKQIVESMRACLIVIVAVVKSKDVDITSYLNKAESFGLQIKSIKIEG